MHAVIEIVMPQVENVEEAVADIMRPFSENEDGNSNAFWDFYVIGGRWAGWKQTATLDEEKLNAFYDEMKEKKVTVSGLQCGKQELAPASQIPMVDEMWAKYFPEYTGRACPLFKHSNDQYANDCLYGDVLRVKDVDPSLKGMDKVIVAREGWADEGEEPKMEAQFMVQGSAWNGCNYEKTTWDGTFEQALKMYAKDIESYREEYRQKYSVDEDWIVVTVDYHS